MRVFSALAVTNSLLQMNVAEYNIVGFSLINYYSQLIAIVYRHLIYLFILLMDLHVE